MEPLQAFVFVFVAGLITALATGLGALPFFLVGEIADRFTVALWGVASGIMITASLLGLISEGLANGTLFEVAIGAVAGAGLVVVAHQLIDDYDADPEVYEQADVEKLLLILGVLTVHSFPEGIAVGVSFADLGLEGDVAIAGVAIPVLAVFMTIAISIHNIPEGVAVSIPLHSMDVANWRLVWWAVFSSLPQPIGAVIAYGFVSIAREFLPYGFGFAAGAMVYLVARELIPEALAIGSTLPRNGWPPLIAGFVAGVLSMVPLAYV
jgi:ZIP family zinc transporter